MTSSIPDNTSAARTPRLDLVERFLLSRGWDLAAVGNRFNTFVAPPLPTMRVAPRWMGGLSTESEPSRVSERTDDRIRLTLPREEKGASTAEFLLRITESLARIYPYSLDQLRVLLSVPDTVVSIQLESPRNSYGAVPFPAFEGMIEKLKSTLLDTASFVLSDLPTVDDIPEEARSYLANCHFLQTEVGSYITKVQLPAEHELEEETLFNARRILGSDVNQKVADVLGFVVREVFDARSEPFSKEVLESNIDVINVNVLNDIADLFRRSSAREMNFTFLSAQSDQRIVSGVLSPQKLERLDYYAEYVRRELAADIPVDARGRIFELRSRGKRRNHNYIGISAIVDNREMKIAVILGARDYYEAVRAHQRNLVVRVAGSARRMKTQRGCRSTSRRTCPRPSTRSSRAGTRLTARPSSRTTACARRGAGRARASTSSTSTAPA